MYKLLESCYTVVYYGCFLLKVGLITFSSGATVQFQLNEHTDVTSLQNALDEVIYKGEINSLN